MPEKRYRSPKKKQEFLISTINAGQENNFFSAEIQEPQPRILTPIKLFKIGDKINGIAGIHKTSLNILLEEVLH